MTLNYAKELFYDKKIMYFTLCNICDNRIYSDGSYSARKFT